MTNSVDANQTFPLELGLLSEYLGKMCENTYKLHGILVNSFVSEQIKSCIRIKGLIKLNCSSI